MRLRNILAPLLMLLVGCSSSGDPGSSASQDEKLIRVAVVGSSQLIDPLIQGFEAAYPGYQVQKVTVSADGDVTGRLARHIENGEVDVIPLGAATARALLGRDLLLPLDRLLQRDGLGPHADQELLAQLRAGGEQVDLPYALRPFVLLYNRRHFDAMGQPLPHSGWSWSDLLNAASAADSLPNVAGFDDGYLRQFATSALMTRDRPPWDATAEQARPLFQTIAALAQTEGALPPPTPPGEGFPIRFPTGEVAMAYVPWTIVQSAAAAPSLDWDFAPLPGGAGAPLLADAATLGIAKTTTRTDAAWLFIAYAAGEEGALMTARSGGIPAYRSPAVQDAWRAANPQLPAGANLVMTAPMAVLPPHTSISPSQWYDLLDETLRVLRAEQVDINDLLRQHLERTTQLQAR